MRYLMSVFVPRLRRRLGDEAVSRILLANPARVYTMPVHGEEPA
jgi:predicted metal-dependent phosphotriesterase family hydrolase